MVSGRSVAWVGAVLLAVTAGALCLFSRPDRVPPPPAPRPVTLLYLDKTFSASHDNARRAMLHNVDVVLHMTVADRGRLVAYGIDDNPLAHSQQVTDKLFASRGVSDFDREVNLCDDWRAARAELTNYVSSPPTLGPTDVVGALTAAGREMQQFPPAARRRVVFLSDMVSTTPGWNTTGTVWTARAINRFVARLRAAHKLPTLPGTEIWVGGAGLAEGQELSSQQIVGMQDLWTAIFRATGGSLKAYGGRLLGETYPPSRRCDVRR